jgi:predicted Zn-dependent peptidase
LRVISETIPGVRSVSAGIWIKAGSRDETTAEAGITHFLEHLVFKGTETRSAREIAETFDSFGGELNAFSAKEYTCLYGRVIDRHLEDALDVLTDMVLRPTISQKDIDSERAVVLEEINMHEDAPSELIHDIFDQNLFQGHPVGPRIIGSAASVRSITRDSLVGYWNESYAAANIVVAAAGNVSHNKLVEQMEAAFSDSSGKPRIREPRALRARKRIFVDSKETQQAHICLGLEAMTIDDPDRFVLGVIDTVLGGGMSSRLFQEIREKRGLAYSVYSFRAQYSDTGSLGVYAGTAPENAIGVIEIVRDEFDRLVEEGLSAKEIARAKEQLKGSTVLGLEDTTTRMNRLGRGLLGGGELLSVNELMDRVDAVTSGDVARVCGKIFSRPMVMAVTGPFKTDAFSAYE